jgi:hypothetical protein
MDECILGTAGKQMNNKLAPNCTTFASVIPSEPSFVAMLSCLLSYAQNIPTMIVPPKTSRSLASCGPALIVSLLLPGPGTSKPQELSLGITISPSQ